MAGGIDWFRWHHGSVTDPKFQLIAKRAGARLGDVLAVWAFALECASASVNRGVVGNLDVESLDCLLCAPDGTTAAIIEAMRARKMIERDGHVAAWERRQPKREDETAAERKRRQREREHELMLASRVTEDASRDVTQGHADVTRGHDRGEESREEITTPQPPKGGKSPIGFKAWLQQIKAAGEKPIPADDPIFGYCQRVGIPDEFLALHWLLFKRRYSEATKRYRDWRKAFRNSVEGNWMRVWSLRDGQQATLTTVGEQARRELDAEREHREAA